MKALCSDRKEDGMTGSREYKATQIISNTVCAIFALLAVLPFLMLVSSSLTDNDYAIQHGFSFIPGKWSIIAYQYIAVEWATIGKAYFMTIIVTVIGVMGNLAISTLFAYGISKTNVPGMKFISLMLVFSMLFNGGIVSTYYTYVRLWHIKNTIFALIVPGLLMSAFSVILIRNYFTTSIPASLAEAARIDGAGEMKVFLRIVLPLSKPILATVGMMSALAYWNDWMNGLYYLTARNGSQYYTIQIVLNNINNDINALLQSKSMIQTVGDANAAIPSTTIRMAIAVIGILPIIAVYPFFQRYFVKGITLGGIKE